MGEESDAEKNIPKRFGRYTIVSQLATGGMAQIYKAQTNAKKVFTLKRILDEYSKQSDFIKMFLEEAKLSLSLNHPNIVRTLDLGQMDGAYYLAMEYVFGRDLGSLLRNSVEKGIYIPIDVACQIILQCCRGLDYAHSRTDSFGKPLGLVHRDISPPNIMISYNGESKILDFGIAKAVSLAPKQKTRSGVLKGKFCYMSPEQAQGLPLDHQSDLFSLGIVLYELLTSKSLFFSPDEIDTLERVRKADVEPPSKIRKGIPKELDRIVLKALDKKKTARFENCADFGRALRKFVQSNYPRGDSRSVAKFVRSIFTEDFQARYEESLSEGWKDILIAGGADEELILDRTANELDAPSVRIKSFIDSGDLHWYQRILYDPKISSKFFRYALSGILILSLFLGLAYLSSSGNAREKITSFYESTKSLFVSSTQDDLEPTEVRFEDIGEVQTGTFSDLKTQAIQAENDGRYEEALLLLDRALEINPFETDLLIRRNFVRMAQGQYEESCQWFESQQDLPAADRSLAIAACTEMQGETQKALVLYRDFLREFSQDKRTEGVKEIIDSYRKRIQP